MFPKLNRETLAQVDGLQGLYSPFFTALPHRGEVEAPSSLKKLRAWEAGQANAPRPEGVITMIPWLTFIEQLPWACSAST